MKGTEQLEKTIYKTLSENSILFLKKAILEVVQEKSEVINKEQAILTSVNIQISLELAVKASVLNNINLKAILTNEHVNDTSEELIVKYKENHLKTKEFDNLKNFIKSNYAIFNISKDQIKQINKFQTYRNKLVHFNYNFSEKELEILKADFIYIIVHVIVPLLSNDKQIKPSEFYSCYLENTQFKKLMNFPLYVSNMMELAKSYGETFYCPYCDHKTLSADILHCFCCTGNFYDNSDFGFVDCIYCGEESSVIYDSANIADNHNIMRGLCLSCKEDTDVYQCPQCEEAFNLRDFSSKEHCTDDNCIYN